MSRYMMHLYLKFVCMFIYCRLSIEKEPKSHGKNVRVQTFSALLDHIFLAIRNDAELWSKVEGIKMEVHICAHLNLKKWAWEVFVLS